MEVTTLVLFLDMPVSPLTPYLGNWPGFKRWENVHFLHFRSVLQTVLGCWDSSHLGIVSQTDTRKRGGGVGMSMSLSYLKMALGKDERWMESLLKKGHLGNRMCGRVSEGLLGSRGTFFPAGPGEQTQVLVRRQDQFCVGKNLLLVTATKGRRH